MRKVRLEAAIASWLVAVHFSGWIFYYLIR
jgi:hypothetical protein